jgi:(S)-ureidoglycine aminohydrolase
VNLKLVGNTRTHVRRDHALIAPDSHVRSPLPGWDGTEGVVLISPHMGARFTQYLAYMNAGAVAAPPPTGHERLLYVVEGEIFVRSKRVGDRKLGVGGFAFLPPGCDVSVGAPLSAVVNVFEKKYVPLEGVEPPAPRFGQEQDIVGAPFLGDPDAMLKTFLPIEPAFDLAVNLFTFRPGAALPFVETHVMEHGLLMVAGMGVYRLADSWYPVEENDVIWMASYCPQWFVAMGKTSARYLYYKDVHRDPLVP